jgi:chromosome segregation ATPase
LSADLYEWRGRKLETQGGGGSVGPTLDQRVSAVERRVERIESKIDRIDEALRRIESALKELASDSKELRKQLGDLSVRVASVEGQLKNLPTVLQLFLALITTWSAGAAIVFALLKAIHP